MGGREAGLFISFPLAHCKTQSPGWHQGSKVVRIWRIKRIRRIGPNVVTAPLAGLGFWELPLGMFQWGARVIAKKKTKTNMIGAWLNDVLRLTERSARSVKSDKSV
jgi:hypothetical protein